MWNEKRVLGLATHDSFEKVVCKTLDLFQECDCEVNFIRLVDKSVGDEVTCIPLSKIHTHIKDNEYDVVIIGLDGRSSRTFLLHYEGAQERPFFVSMYPGIIFREHINGFVDRSMVDVLCLNSEFDLALYKQAARSIKVRSDNAIVTGLPLLWRAPTCSKESNKVVYFDQPSVPSKRKQRDYVAKSLLTLAIKYPDYEFIFKPRIKIGGRTLHRERSSIELAFDRLGAIPPNLEISHRSATSLINDAGLVITVSSSAAVEAMAMGVPVKIITDFGINETLGNVFYIGSDCFSDFLSIDPNENSVINQSWLHSVAYNRDGFSILKNRLASIIDSKPSKISFEFYSRAWLDFMGLNEEYPVRTRISHYLLDLLIRVKKKVFS